VTSFIVCRTCGRYVAGADVINRAYCSQECTAAYTSCTNCGKYFPSGTGVDGQTCSNECTVRYQILRKYGPEPVTVVTEV